jgi:uroporphyrinogen decarboxylase
LANIDYCVDPVRAAQALPHTCLNGNLKPLSFVTATPAEIRDEASRLLNLFASRGGFVLSSGCEIPPEAQPETIAALVAAAQRPG